MLMGKKTTAITQEINLDIDFNQNMARVNTHEVTNIIVIKINSMKVAMTMPLDFHIDLSEPWAAQMINACQTHLQWMFYTWQKDKVQEILDYLCDEDNQRRVDRFWLSQEESTALENLKSSTNRIEELSQYRRVYL